MGSWGERVRGRDSEREKERERDRAHARGRESPPPCLFKCKMLYPYLYEAPLVNYKIFIKC